MYIIYPFHSHLNYFTTLSRQINHVWRIVCFINATSYFALCKLKSVLLSYVANKILNITHMTLLYILLCVATTIVTEIGCSLCYTDWITCRRDLWVHFLYYMMNANLLRNGRWKWALHNMSFQSFLAVVCAVLGSLLYKCCVLKLEWKNLITQHLTITT